METLNNEKKVDSQITSRYTIVLATAKRARQIIDGANPLTYAPTDRAVSIAVKELSEGKLLIKSDPALLEVLSERPLARSFQGISTVVSKDEELREDYSVKKEKIVRGDDDDDDDEKDLDDYKAKDDFDDEDKTDDLLDKEYEDEEDYNDEDYEDDSKEVLEKDSGKDSDNE
jgi:DNA-directed RNA polymerase subunit omega